MYDCTIDLMFPISAMVENNACRIQKQNKEKKTKDQIRNVRIMYYKKEKPPSKWQLLILLTRRQYVRMDCHLNSNVLNSV